jgi:hypothetical protein
MVPSTYFSNKRMTINNKYRPRLRPDEVSPVRILLKSDNPRMQKTPLIETHCCRGVSFSSPCVVS